MKIPMLTDTQASLPVLLHHGQLRWLITGGGPQAAAALQVLLSSGIDDVSVVAPAAGPALRALLAKHDRVTWIQRDHIAADLEAADLVIAATSDPVFNRIIADEAAALRVLVCLPGNTDEGHFSLQQVAPASPAIVNSSERQWKRLASRLIIAFSLMVVGHIIISYLPLPAWKQVWQDLSPTFDTQFFLFVLAGFVAQMVDGVLSMGYGVTSATCLMSLGISPVAVSAAIHTSEVFTTGISGYSHYKFGNVNKKMFRHLVIPGVLGAILGAALLVYLGERAGKWLMPAHCRICRISGPEDPGEGIRAAQQKPQGEAPWTAGSCGRLS
jgi:hypothetical protein